MTIRVLDLFCGAGGSSAGARGAGAEIIGGIDAWGLAAQTFQANFSNAIVETRELFANSGPAKAMSAGDIDLLVASPECTNHSPAKGSKPRCEASRGTSHYVLNFARKLRPRWIVLENVVQLRNWQGYDILLNGLSHAGYRIRTQVLDAVDFGVPQTRRRLFVLCDLESEPPPIKLRQRKHRTAENIVQIVSPWESTPLRRDGRAAATLERAERAIAALGRGTPFLIVYYGSDGSGGWQPLQRPLRTMTTLDRFGLVTWEGREPMLRMLQVDELRDAMGFPATYKLKLGTRRDRIKMLGNAVAPPVMAAIVETLTSPGSRRTP